MPIRVLLVEDSPVALTVLTKILKQSPDIEVVGAASTGVEALALIPQKQPQVICTDLHMPHMDGLALTTEIMARFPAPILVISVSVQPDDTQQVFRLLEAGAVDVFPKPVAGLSAESLSLNAALIEKIKILAGVRVFKKKRSPPLNVSPLAASPLTASPVGVPSSPIPPLNLSKLAQDGSPIKPRKRPKIIAIGASTGGPTALHTLLRQLPKQLPPMICVQHIGAGFLQGLVDWLQTDCTLRLQIAKAGEQPQPGNVYFSLEQQHLLIDDRGRFAYCDWPLVDGHRPSITVAFQSVAEYYGAQSVGILLTGMGRDGAVGLKAIADAGGVTLAQDEATSVVFGMPKVALELGAVEQVLPIEAIAPTLLQHLKPFAPSTASQ